MGGIPIFSVIKAGGAYIAHYDVRDGFVGGFLDFYEFLQRNTRVTLQARLRSFH